MQRKVEDLDWDSTCGAYMKAVDLPEGGATLTIAAVAQAEIRDTKARRDDAVKSAWVVHWKEDGWRPLILNTTLKKVLRALCGPTIGDAIGRPITLYNDQTVSLGSARVGGVRIMGAPWLERDLEVEIQPNPRKRPERVTLRRTGPPKRDARPVEPPAETVEAWAARRGFALAAVDGALSAGGKPSRDKLSPRQIPQAIAWLEGDGKAVLADVVNTLNSTIGD